MAATRKLPLFQRKTELKKIIDGTEIQFSESFEIEGREMFEHACKIGLEGVVSKVWFGASSKRRLHFPGESVDERKLMSRFLQQSRPAVLECRVPCVADRAPGAGG